MLNQSAFEDSLRQPSPGKPSPDTPSPNVPLPARLPPLFDLGRVVATPAALEALRDALVEPEDLLNRHGRGDWGDLDAADRAANGQALVSEERLLSAYTLPGTGEKIWIITEWDRSSTSLLLPKEY